MTVKRNFENMGVIKDSNLESDFIYGAHGYIAILIRRILLNNQFSKGSKIDLLSYLIKIKNAHPELSDLPLRKETKKDQLSSYFLENYGNNEKNLMELINRCKKLFKE